MALKAEDFDRLRETAEGICDPVVTEAYRDIIVKRLFLDIINDMEKIQGMIIETKIDLTKHDENGKVTMPDYGDSRD